MNKTAVYHEIDSAYCYGISDDKLILKIRVAKKDNPIIEINYVDRFKYYFMKEKGFISVKMNRNYEDDLFAFYEAEIDFDVLSMGYFFSFIEEDKVYYGNYKFFKELKFGNEYDEMPEMFTMPVLDSTDIFKVPKWTEEAIIYHIFPERFYYGNSNEMSINKNEWHGKVDNEKKLGGNLQGIIDKLDYLHELGINTIYLNPIFKAEFSHKYCTTNYFEIDPDFGNLEIFKKLVEEAHSRDIRIILDAVFSSTGINFFAFKDILENQEDSKYKDWYKIENFPIDTNDNANYKSFAHFSLLPKLNYDSEKMQNHLLEVLEYWIKEADIDGWRLDVADEVPHSFWKKARQLVKKTKEDAVLVGEVWYDSQSWLQGDEFDTVMNYQFMFPVIDFIVKKKITAKEFGEKISWYLARYKKQTHKLLWNLIDSHDTERFLHRAEEDIEKLKLAVILQFTIIGSPTIYYGDEVGISGGKDPDNRRGMLWEDRQNKGLLDFYKDIIKIRKEEEALVYGMISFLDEGNDILHFVRKYKNQAIHVYINNGRTSYHKKLEKQFENLYDGVSVSDMELKSGGFLILKEKI